MAVFPIDNPQYIVMTFIDEPKSGERGGGTISAYTALPIARDIVARSAPILGVQPSFGKDDSALLASY
jgi:cell division protein FtsI (penicillin-binding protein 3)